MKGKERAESKGYLCKECNAARSKKWNKENPGRLKERFIQKKYGLTFDEYRKMFNAQNGNCYICQKPEKVKEARTGKLRFLAVDHCHKSGKVRALLCTSCNTTLGKFDDNVDILSRMIDYLKEFDFVT